jgi:chromosome segregation ATPase
MENLTEEEREEIFSQINEAATGTRLENRGAHFEFTPSKRGSLFPIVVNLLAVLIIAGAVYYAERYYSRQEEQLNVKADAYLSAEGKIIEELKKETERRLEEKDNEIKDIRQSLAENMQQRIEEREEQLRAELQRELVEERSRLEARGMSEEELQRQLEQFRENRSEELETAIADFRSEMQQELEQKQQELAEAEATAERILQEANRERQELLEESRQREAELRSEFEEERERLTAQTSRAQEELEELSKLRENEQLILDQISSMYLGIKSSLQAGNSQQAIEKIDELRELIESPSVSRMPTLSKRREVDTFLLSTLEEYVNKTRRSAGETSLLDSAKRLSSAKAAVESAQQALNEGDTYTAQRYFTQALTTIPEIETAHNEVARIDGLRRGERVEELISLGEEQRDAGEIEAALDRFISAAAEASPYNADKAREAATRLQTLLQARYEGQIEERNAEYRENREELQTRISTLSSRLEEVNGELTEAREELSQLEERNSRSTERIAALESRVEELREEKTQAETELTGLRTEKERLEEQYTAAQERAEELRKDMEEAADEIASLVAGSETNTLLREAVDRYSSFRSAQRDILSSGEPMAPTIARERFERFLRSEEISSLFPGLPQLYAQSHPE